MQSELTSLPIQLQQDIKARPTNTFIRSEHPEYQTQYQQMFKNIADKNFLDVKIPDNFDGRIVWKGAIVPPKNQGTCSSCWAFASVGCLNDKFNIQSMGLLNLELSVAKLILCAGQGSPLIDISKHSEEIIPPIHIQNLDISGSEKEQQYLENSACFGNSLYNAWNYLYTIGTNLEKCVPYNKNYGTFQHLPPIGSFTSPEKLPTCLRQLAHCKICARIFL